MGSLTSPYITSVGISAKGSMKAVFGSGIRSMSLSWIAAQPRILDPSMPKPSSKLLSSSSLTESSFEEGFGMDGSSIRGWAAIHESDMLLIPDPNTAFMDPFAEIPTLVMYGDVKDPITKQRYERDPRWIAQKAELYLNNSGVADAAYFGAEAEFFIFDNVSFDQNQHCGFYFIDAEEGRWNSGRRENNLGYRPRYKEGYFPVPPTDHYQDLRSEMVQTMIKCGLNIECHHHEV